MRVRDLSARGSPLWGRSHQFLSLITADERENNIDNEFTAFIDSCQGDLKTYSIRLEGYNP